MRSSASAVTKPTASPIKIGVLNDISGTASIQGALTRTAVEMGIANINSSGGVKGHPVQAEYADPRSDAAEAIQLATRLIQQDKVDVLMGGAYSAECLGV
ncbi:MAG: ABC transporter substrate-binding protein, partial [Chloroflexota bacterium]|nr:ABC transporter substrate-binding protein [Chloroflexota bacterium]